MCNNTSTSSHSTTLSWVPGVGGNLEEEIGCKISAEMSAGKSILKFVTNLFDHHFVPLDGTMALIDQFLSHSAIEGTMINTNHIINTADVGHQEVIGALPLFFKCNKAEVLRLVVLRLVNRPYYFRNCAKLERMSLREKICQDKSGWIFLKLSGQD